MAMSLSARDHTIEQYTRTVCPACFAEGPLPATSDAFVDGMLVSANGSVWMQRFCPVHGESRSLYEEDLEIWRARAGWSTPTLRVIPDRADNWRGFPLGYRNGLPASHGQHTCILLLNLTRRCNYSCPTCYASALAPGQSDGEPERPSLDEVLHTVDTMLAREQGKLGVLMLSGGEPTVRRDLGELIPQLFERNIVRIMLNTNGARIARDDRLLELLRQHRERVEVYLQFDSRQTRAGLELRGEDVLAEKQLALSRLEQAGVFTTLVMSVARGVNEDQVSEVLQLGLDTPHCSGLAIQPVFGSGRIPGVDPQSRCTPTGVLRRLGWQTKGLLSHEDFIPLPCSHPDCCDITYLLRGRDDRWRSLPALIGRERLRGWAHLIANSITFSDLKEPVAELLKSGAFQRVFSEQLKVGALQLASDILKLCSCAPELSGLVDHLWARVRRRENPMERMAERTFRVTVKMFMDAHTFHEARIRQCCVHTGTYEQDPRRYSFCWRWLFSDAQDFPDDLG